MNARTTTDPGDIAAIELIERIQRETWMEPYTPDMLTRPLSGCAVLLIHSRASWHLRMETRSCEHNVGASSVSEALFAEPPDPPRSRCRKKPVKHSRRRT